MLGDVISLRKRCSGHGRLAIMREFSAGGATPICAAAYGPSKPKFRGLVRSRKKGFTMSTQQNTQRLDRLSPLANNSMEGFRVSFALLAIALAIVLISWIFDPGFSAIDTEILGAKIVGP